MKLIAIYQHQKSLTNYEAALDSSKIPLANFNPLLEDDEDDDDLPKSIGFRRVVQDEEEEERKQSHLPKAEVSLSQTLISGTTALINEEGYPRIFQEDDEGLPRNEAFPA